MKTVTKITSIILILSLIFPACKKDIHPEMNKNIKANGFSERSINNNPYDVFGEDFINAFSYVEDYHKDILDSSKFCPIEYTNFGVKNYTFEVKLKNRIIHYYDSLGYFIDGDLMNDVIYLSSTIGINDLLVEGISQVEIDYMQQVSGMFSNIAKLEHLHDSLDVIQGLIINDTALNVEATERLLASLSIFNSMIELGLDRDLTYLWELDEIAVFAIPCGAATLFYAAAFVGLCAATGPIGVTVAVIGFGGSVWGVLDAC